VTDVEVVTPGENAVYRRGLGMRSVVRGTLLRFLPGSLLSSTAVFVYLNGFAPPSLAETATLAVGFGLGLSAGFGVALGALRKRLYPDADVDGYRSLIAGLLAPLAVLMVTGFVGGIGLSSLPWVLGIGGVASAATFFFPWLTPTPRSMLDPRYVSPATEDEHLGAGSSVP